MSENPLICEFRGAVAWLTLNRPDKLNALSSGLINQLGAALDAIEAREDCRVVVITGAGDAFCAGGDLKEFRSHLEEGRPEGLEAFVRGVSATFRRLETLPQPVIVAVNGTAVAGGLELILSCDIVLAAAGAKIGDGHLNYGVLPGGGAAARLPRKIPRNVAAELFLTAELKPAEWWERLGFVSRVLPLECLLEVAEIMAERIAGFSPLAATDMKRMLLATPDLDHEGALAHELDVFARHTRRADFLEGLRAFAERRRPVFKGR